MHAKKSFVYPNIVEKKLKVLFLVSVFDLSVGLPTQVLQPVSQIFTMFKLYRRIKIDDLLL